MRRSDHAAVMTFVAAVLFAGCNPYRCLVQSRFQRYDAQIGGGPIAGRGVFELTETRGAENATLVLWHVRASPLPAAATRVFLREGTADTPGRLLYEFPLMNAVPESGVITQAFAGVPHAGPVPFAELWELVQRQPVSFEIVFGSGPPPLRIGPLNRAGSGDWQDVCT